MNLTTAQQAGAIAASITQINAYLSNLSALLNAGYTIVSCNTILENSNTPQAIDFSPLSLTVAETATIAAAVQSVLNARLTAANASLAGM